MGNGKKVVMICGCLWLTGCGSSFNIQSQGINQNQNQSSHEDPNSSHTDTPANRSPLETTPPEAPQVEPTPDPLGNGALHLVDSADEIIDSILTAQAGDVIQISAGEFEISETISDVNGTQEHPIIIRGDGLRETTLSGNSKAKVFRIENCSYIIFENLNFKNPDSNRESGRTNRVSRSAGPNEEGIVIAESQNLIFRKNVFDDIGTRGILIQRNSTEILIEHNLFADVGNNTAAGDVAIGSNSSKVTVRYNLLGGNTDGVVQEGARVGNLIEFNYSVNHWQENCFDIKKTNSGRSNSNWTRIENNICNMQAMTKLNGMAVQDLSKNVIIENNLFEGGSIRDDGRNPDAIVIQGRGIKVNGVYQPSDDFVESIIIRNNHFNGNGDVEAIVASINSAAPAQIRDVTVTDNTFESYQIFSRLNAVSSGLESDNNLQSSQPERFTDLKSHIMEVIRSLFTEEEIQRGFEGSNVDPGQI